MQDKLQELLVALDGQEKRYVSLYLERPGAGGKNYRELYDACVHLPEKLQQIEKRLGRAGYTLTRHLLYDQVLKALRIYHTASSVETRLTEGLAEWDLLFAKKLHRQCRSLLRRLERLSGPHIRPHLRIELLSRELRLLHAMQDTRALSDKYQRVFKEQLALAEESRQLLELQNLSYESFLTLKKHWIGKKGDIVLRRMQNYPEKKLHSLQAKVIYLQVLSARLFAAGKTEQAFQSLVKLRVLFDKHPPLQEVLVNQYIALLNNLNVLLVERCEFRAVLDNTARLRSINTRSKERNLRILERALNAEVNVYRRMGDLAAARRTLDEALHMLDQGQASSVYELLFLLDAFVIHFMEGEFRTALRMLNRLLNRKNENLRPDLMRAARVFALFVHYELGNEDVLDKLCRQYLAGGKPDSYEKTVIGFFMTLPDRLDKRKAFRELESDIRTLSADPRIFELYTEKFDMARYARYRHSGTAMSQETKEGIIRKKKK